MNAQAYWHGCYENENAGAKRFLWKVRAKTGAYALPVASRAPLPARPKMGGLLAINDRPAQETVCADR